MSSFPVSNEIAANDVLAYGLVNRNSVGQVPRSRMVGLLLMSEASPRCQHGLASLETSTSIVESSHCSHVLAGSWCHRTANVLSVAWYNMKSHCNYNLQLQMMNQGELSFMSVGCSCFFWETPAHVFCPFIYEVIVIFFLQEFPVSSMGLFLSDMWCQCPFPS